MNRKLVLLNVALVALLGLLGWQLRQRWIEARVAEAAIINQSPKPDPVQPPPPVPPVEPPVPADYIDVAQRTLFAQDRDPNVIIEPPPPPPPPEEKPLPPLPSYHGQMALGTPSIVLSVAGKGQKAYYAGDQVGEFKLVSFDQERITLEFDGKPVERKLSDLDKEEKGAPKRVAAAPKPAAAPPKSNTKIGGAPKSGDPRGRFVGGKYMCKADDGASNGTVYEGYRKTEVVTMMGPTCAWERVE